MTAPAVSRNRKDIRKSIKCQQLAEILKHSICEGRYTPHAPLPSYREISKQYGVCVRTVWDAMVILEREGLLYRMERRGTFVRGNRQSEAGATSNIRCINFVEDYWPIRTEHNKVDYLTGYTEALEQHDIKTRFIVCPEEGERYEPLLSDGLSYEAQGCVLVNRARPSLLHWLTERKILFVVQYNVAYSREGLPPHHSVFVNKTGGAFAATQHLLEMGHCRIGFIGSLPGGKIPSVVYEGYRAAMACAALEYSPHDVLNFVTDDPAAAVNPVAEFLKHSGRPTAVLTETDAMAMAVLHASKSLGIKIPEELSVIGFNDQPEAVRSEPKLTTVSVPRRMLAKKAVEILLDAREGKDDTYQNCILECALVVRESTARPKAD